MKNFKRAVNGAGTTTAAGKISYLRAILHREALREFNKLASQNSGTNHAHLKLIQEGLLTPPPRLTPFPGKSAQCAVHCINLATPLSTASPPVSHNLTTTSLFFRIQRLQEDAPQRT